MVIIGCGGNGASTGPAFVKPKISLAWGSRAFDIGGPGSALSAVIVFDRAGSHGEDLSFSVDRNVAPGAYSQSYTFPTSISSGSYLMHVRFQAQAGGIGDVVAYLDASVIVDRAGNLDNANGKALGNIQATGTIVNISIVSGQSFVVGTPTDIQISAWGTSGNYLALSPGSVTYQVTPGSGSATINGKGQFVGQTTGNVTLTATVDGISSFPDPVNITNQPATVSTLNQPTNSMVYNSGTGHFWASVPGTDPHYGNSIIEIDPATQKIISSIPVGSEPNALAISDDSSTLYVSLTGANAIRRVDLNAKAAGMQFAVTGNSFATDPYAYALAVQPGNPNVVAATLQDHNDSGSLGPQLYNNGVPLPHALGIYEGTSIGFTSPSTLWSGMDFSPATLHQCTVDANGASEIQTIQATGGVLKTFGNNVIVNTGQMYDGTSGTLLGTFSSSGDFTMDLVKGKTYSTGWDFTTSQFEIQVFDTSTFRTLGSYPVPNIVGFPNSNILNLSRFGANGLAFRDTNTVYFVMALPNQ